MDDRSSWRVNNNTEVGSEVMENRPADLASALQSRRRGEFQPLSHDQRGIDHAFLGRSQVAALDALTDLPREIHPRKEHRRKAQEKDFPVEAVERRRQEGNHPLDKAHGAGGRGVGLHSLR